MHPPRITRRRFIAGTAATASSLLATAGADPGQEEVNLVLLGDWGANTALTSKDPDTTPNDLKHFRDTQDRTARALGKWLADNQLTSKLDGILLLGDNFYGALDGVNDKRWKTTFQDHFDPQQFPMNFYVALGNHDFEDEGGNNWRGEIDFARQKKDPRWLFPAEKDTHTWYRLDLPSKEAPILTLFVFNTSSDAITKKKAGERQIDNWEAQKAWLAHQLEQEIKAPWLAGSGHYPMYTNGDHFLDSIGQHHDFSPWDDGRKGLMTPLLGKKAQFWFGAHDHNLQFLRHKDGPGMEFIVSGGGGGDQLHGTKGKGGKGAKLGPGDVFEEGPGWVWVTLTRDKATTRICNVVAGPHDTVSISHAFERAHGDAKSAETTPH